MRQVEPGQFTPGHTPDVVSVWTRPDDLTIVSDPKVEGDTLSGVVLEERWAVPLKDVLRVEVQASDPRRTALLVAGTAASAVGLYLISNSGRGGGMIPCPPNLPPFQQVQQCGATP